MANVNYAQTKYNYDGAYLTGIQGTATGTIVPWGTGTAPSGFLECDGSAVSRTTYAALFAVIGTTYGAGDTTTTFNVPNLTDRTVVSKSNTKALASTGGANTVIPTGNISGSTGATTLQTTQIPSHTHTGGSMGSTNVVAPGEVGITSSGGQTGSTGGGSSHDHTLSANFVGSANSVLQPYLTLMYIIKT